MKVEELLNFLVESAIAEDENAEDDEPNPYWDEYMKNKEKEQSSEESAFAEDENTEDENAEDDESNFNWDECMKNKEKEQSSSWNEYKIEKIESAFAEDENAEDDEPNPNWDEYIKNKEKEQSSPWNEYKIDKIAIGVIKTRVRGSSIPFIEHHAFIAKTSRGTISAHYERNKERPIIKRINDPDIHSEWELTQYFIPRRGITVADLDKNVGKFWVFPKFRYIQAILPTLFEQHEQHEQKDINALKKDWGRISLFQYIKRKLGTIVSSIKEFINSCLDCVTPFIRRIYLWILSLFS